MEHRTKQTHISASGVWLTAALLVVLVLATLALLASFIMGYTAGEKNVISIMADSFAMRKEYNDDAFPAGAEPGMETSWSTETSVDLFKTAYTGPDGTVTVESAAGDKLIAPGTGSSYEFNLKNTGNIALDYTLTLKGLFRLSDRDLPLYVRLRQGDRWVMGGENQWIHVDEMNTVEDTNTLPRASTAAYIFEWQWPYESDEDTRLLLKDLNDTPAQADRKDTALGNTSVDTDTEFRLDIAVTAGIAPGAIAEFDDGSSILNRFLLVCALAALILGSGIWLIVLLLMRRRFYLTGIVLPAYVGTACLDRSEAETENSRFSFPRARLGRHTLTLGEERLQLRFKRSRDVEGLQITAEGDVTVVTMGRKVRAAELFMDCLPGSLHVQEALWAAIDSDHTVFTHEGSIPAVDGENRTPAGLTVDKDGNFTVEKTILHV